MRSLLLFAVLPLACAHAAESNDLAASQPAERVQPVADSRGVAPSSDERQLQGTIAEGFDAAGYTYMRVSLDGGSDVWAAAEQQPFEVGARVVLETSIKMRNFHSKALGRTFDEIYFVKVQSLTPKAEAPSDFI